MFFNEFIRKPWFLWSILIIFFFKSIIKSFRLSKSINWSNSLIIISSSDLSLPISINSTILDKVFKINSVLSSCNQYLLIFIKITFSKFFVSFFYNNLISTFVLLPFFIIIRVFRSVKLPWITFQFEFIIFFTLKMDVQLLKFLLSLL